MAVNYHSFGTTITKKGKQPIRMGEVSQKRESITGKIVRDMFPKV
jgi:hypothetical protein